MVGINDMPSIDGVVIILLETIECEKEKAFGL